MGPPFEWPLSSSDQNREVALLDRDRESVGFPVAVQVGEEDSVGLAADRNLDRTRGRKTIGAPEGDGQVGGRMIRHRGVRVTVAVDVAGGDVEWTSAGGNPGAELETAAAVAEEKRERVVARVR